MDILKAVILFIKSLAGTQNQEATSHDVISIVIMTLGIILLALVLAILKVIL